MKKLHPLIVAAVLAVAGCAAPTVSTSPREPASAGKSIEGVAAGTLDLRDFRLQSGVVMREVTIAYETYGELDRSGRNAILITHGNTSSFHAAGRYARHQAALGVNETQLGWWDDLIGPGKAFDTDKYFVVSSNMLGGAFGTTGPRSINPATGKPYGPDFPDITLADMAAAQHALLDALGVKHLVAVAGPSWYYERGGIKTALTDLRVATLKAYGIEDQLAQAYPDRAAREAEIRKRAEPWASHFDGNSLVVQRKAMEFRDHEKDFGRIKAKVLYVLSTTDKLFPPSLAPNVMAKLGAAGVDATYYELVSDKGHNAGTQDARKYEPALRAFLQRLESAR